MTEKTEQAFTVFTECGTWQNSHPEVGVSVAQICAWLAQEAYAPVAWMEGDALLQDGDIDQLRAESLAAGRTIELVDGKYVARGVAVDNGGGSGCIAPANTEPPLDPLPGWEQWSGRRAYVPTTRAESKPHPSRFAVLCADLEPRGYLR